MDVSENTLQLSNGQMHYIQFGNGKKTFVIIAGMSMTGISGMGQVVADMYRAFTDEYTVYLFERLSSLPDGYTIRNMADDVAAAMNLLCISDADIMGASQGGMIALYLAIDHPELVHSMVLASSCCRQNNVGKLTFKLWSELADRRDGRAIYRDFFSRVYTVSPADLLKKIENTATDEQCRRFGIMARACCSFDCSAELDRVRCPVLVIGAENDNVLGKGASEELAEKLGCELYIYQDYAHAVYDEAPDCKLRLLQFFRNVEQ